MAIGDLGKKEDIGISYLQLGSLCCIFFIYIQIIDNIAITADYRLSIYQSSTIRFQKNVMINNPLLRPFISP